QDPKTVADIAQSSSRLDSREPTTAGEAAPQVLLAGGPPGSAAVFGPSPTASTSACSARARARSDDAPSTRRRRVALRTPSGARPLAGPSILRASSIRGALPRRVVHAE